MSNPVAPTLTQTSTSFTCLATNCGSLDISNTDYLYSFKYQITFNVGGTTGNKVKEVTSNIHNVELT